MFSLISSVFFPVYYESQSLGEIQLKASLSREGYFSSRHVVLLSESKGGYSQDEISSATKISESSIGFDLLTYIKNNLEAIKVYRENLKCNPLNIDRSSPLLMAKIVQIITKFFEKLAFLSRSPFHSNEELKDLNDAQKSYYDEFNRELEFEMLELAGATEQISNISKNLTDLYELSVGKEESVVDVAADFIKALEKSKENAFSNFEYRTEVRMVSPRDKSNLKTLYLNLTGTDKSGYREALIEYLNAKKAQSNGSIHLSTSLLNRIRNCKIKKEGYIIGFYLMGEICKIKGGARLLDLDQLKKLLKHDLISHNSFLVKGVLAHARKVILEAIRNKQSNIIWDSNLKHEEKRSLQQELEKEGVAERLLDFDGLKKLAQGIDLTTESFKPSSELEMQLSLLEKIKGL